MLPKLAIAVLTALALILVLPGAPSLEPRAAEAYPGADNFRIVGQQCLGPTNVRLQMQWTAYGFGPQWFDVSLSNNGWILGTFVGTGPLDAYQTSLTWDGFIPNALHYLRVNTYIGGVWYQSQTVSFVTIACGGGGGGGGIGKTGPHCDGSTWCAGDGMPTMCAQQGLYNGCVWVNRIFSDPFSYVPGSPVAICYWVPSPGPVYIQTVSQPSFATAIVVNGYDDGMGDCQQGTAGLPGSRTTTLYFNGAYADQVLWRVN